MDVVILADTSPTVTLANSVTGERESGDGDMLVLSEGLFADARRLAEGFYDDMGDGR